MYTFEELEQAFRTNNLEIINPLIDSEKLELFDSLTLSQLTILSQLSYFSPCTKPLMHRAVIVGNLELLKLLHRKGLNIYWWGLNYVSIHCAAIENKPHVIQWLIDINPTLINTQSRYYLTPLKTAAENNSLESMICLIKNGAQYVNEDLIDILCRENPTYRQEYFNKPMDSNAIIACLEKIITTVEYKNSKI